MPLITLTLVLGILHCERVSFLCRLSLVVANWSTSNVYDAWAYAVSSGCVYEIACKAHCLRCQYVALQMIWLGSQYRRLSFVREYGAVRGDFPNYWLRNNVAPPYWLIGSHYLPMAGTINLHRQFNNRLDSPELQHSVRCTIERLFCEMPKINLCNYV